MGTNFTSLQTMIPALIASRSKPSCFAMLKMSTYQFTRRRTQLVLTRFTRSEMKSTVRQTGVTGLGTVAKSSMKSLGKVWTKMASNSQMGNINLSSLIVRLLLEPNSKSSISKLRLITRLQASSLEVLSTIQQHGFSDQVR